ncbi:hypothetical protein [Streptomyces lonarensis]|uniref:Uncharacterized protein n=1 Tax=Streptomyces lonarensis TaxID=700599 RepID=A0A7X6D2T8_9ACTN|nr:hypothetical protein [Streptomyces lonarensis]NJQ07164.1 hypothetical protein [Streptomyces lonarensis]
MTHTGSSPLAHRTVLAVPDAHAPIDTVRRVGAGWLTERFGRAPTHSGHHRLGEAAVLTNQAAYRPDGSEHAVRLQLREDGTDATWRTTVTCVTAPEGGALVAVTLEGFAREGTAPEGSTREGTAREPAADHGAPPPPQRPPLVRELVRELRPLDGLAPLTLDARPIGPEEVDELIDILCDPGRRLPAIVAAAPLQPEPLWWERLAAVVDRCAGAASVHLLRDTAAVDAFRAAVGEHHRVAPGAVRTFRTDADPGWPADGARHRYLTVTRLTGAGDRAWLTIAPTVQRIASRAPVPEPLRAVRFTEETRRRDEQRRAALTAGGSHALDALRRENAELKQLLALADADLRESRTETDLANRSADAREAELRALQQLYDEDFEDALRMLQELDSARVQLRDLRQRLRERGRAGVPGARQRPASSRPPERQDVPSTFEELLQRCAAAFPSLTVTADPGPALRLDECDGARRWARKAWQALGALDSYADGVRGGFRGGFSQHCQEGRAGSVTWPRNQLATNESPTTMAKWGAQRVFEVPSAIDPSGRAVMEAHLKLGSKGSSSPRIYYLDDTRGKGRTRSVIVGYIGPHLTNTRS